ncbi:MAG: hypothetical protein WAM77_03360 [Xanthobacteraceae bacterium]
MASLVADTISKLATEVHDYESFGRALVGFLINSAAGHVQKKENLSTDGQMVTGLFCNIFPSDSGPPNDADSIDGDHLPLWPVSP